MRSDNYLRRMLANPAQPPQIDWQHYANTVPIPGLVDSFRAQYEKVKIPVPSIDSAQNELNQLEKQAESDIAKFKQESEQRISGLKQQIHAIESMIPVKLMTMEDFYVSNPEFAQKMKNPTVLDDGSENKPKDGH